MLDGLNNSGKAWFDWMNHVLRRRVMTVGANLFVKLTKGTNLVMLSPLQNEAMELS